LKVRWSDDADRDREEIVEYIWQDNPLAAERMDALFQAAATRLGRFPKLGREGTAPGTRELIPHPSYRLVYQLQGDDVVVLALVHTSRQWPPEPDKGDA
jgi:addiction module RelE/StbE family toxin